MAQQPTDADIDAFMAMVPLIARSEVIARLKGNNNNVEQAVGEYFDSPDSGTKYRYDESQFHSDRDGTMNTQGVSFEVQGPDEYGPAGPSGRFDGAMSRPPSRVHNKSPFSKIIDLTTEHAAADPKDSIFHGDQQDRDLQQALAASRVDAGLPPQETGITGTDQVYFGPANRSQYEQGKWEMVPLSKTSAQEILLDPEPANRKRDLDVPAFLKPSIENHRLGALITIYHEIPLIREIFLDRIDLLPSYGHDTEWWTGKPIELPSLIGGNPIEHEVDRELQRLMAFLDKTDRSYGSIEALANMRDVKRAQRRYPDLEPAVLHAWRSIFENQPAVIKKIFSRGVPSEAEQDGDDAREFAILELALPNKESYNETIYDIADEVLWPSLGSRELSESPYLSHVADVMVFKVEGDEYHKEIEVPAVWYPDRYLLQGREAAWEMRVAKMEVEDELRRIATTEERLTLFQARNGKIVKVQDLFSASLRHDEAEIKEDGIPRDAADMDLMLSQRPSKVANLSAQLRKVIASIDRKLTALNEEKEKALETMRKLSKLYTSQSDNPDAPKLTKYTLRGVSTTKSTTYICRRAEPDLIDMDLDSDGPKEQGDQWWKINYATSGSNPVTVEKTTQENVLEAAKSESKKTILVYASEKAMNWELKALPIPLENFVRWDNAAFRTEFPEAEDSQTQVSSPGKRKRFEDSEDSSPINREPSISERELRNSEEPGPSSGWDGGAQPTTRNIATRINGNGSEEGQEVIVGVDPSLLSNDRAEEARGQEMQERGGMPMLSGRQLSKAENEGAALSTIDSMDLDRVMEDVHTAEESAAVRHVEFKG